MKKKSLKIIFYLKLYIITETKWDKNHTQIHPKLVLNF